MTRIPGAVAATLLSGAAWAVTHILYVVLLVRYHSNPRLVALIGVLIAAAVVLRWLE